jgi:hypothetical protein
MYIRICTKIEHYIKKDIFFFSCRSFWINSASCEYKNRFANKGPQFVPMGIPKDWWKTWARRSNKILSMRNSSHEESRNRYKPKWYTSLWSLHAHGSKAPNIVLYFCSPLMAMLSKLFSKGALNTRPSINFWYATKKSLIQITSFDNLIM